MAETKMQLADWLDDLCVRFILNLPQEELTSVERICFQAEEAQWFYEDFVRPIDPSLPSMNLRQFCLLLFQVCPLLCDFSHEQHLNAYSQFLAYKTRVPVRGVIMLNDSMDQVVLVKGYKKGANWSFPRGKINKDEKDLDCAIREAYEETGFNLSDAGLVPDDFNVKYIEVTMREQHMKLFVFRDVPRDTYFQPRTRKEISKIGWWDLATLPGWKKKKQGSDHHDAISANKLYMVAPFLQPLRKWITQQRKADVQAASESAGNAYMSTADAQVTDGDAFGEDELLSDAPQQYAPHDSWQQAGTGSVQPGPPTQVDAAAHMKALLGVQQPLYQQQPVQPPFSNPAHPPLDQKSGNLLALLRGTNVSDPRAAGPRTPFDQVSFQAQEPRSPTHHHQIHAASVANNGPPPPFPAMPPTHPPPQAGHQPQKSSFGGYGPNGMYSSQQAFGGAGIFGPRRESVGQSASSASARQASLLASQFQISDAGQRTAAPSSEGPVAPAPSQLPAPRLSSHAQGLLSMFNNPSAAKTPSPAPVAVQAPIPQIPRQAALQPPIGTPPQKPRPDSASRNNSLQAFGGLIPSNVVSRRDSSTSAKATEKPKPKPTEQQNALLGLFKGTSPAPAAQSTSKASTVLGPAELAAHRSPAPPSQASFGQPALEARSSNKERIVPKILQRPDSGNPQAAVEIPAVTTPKAVLQEAEAPPSKKKRQERTPRKAAKAKSPAFTPTQILKRPTEAIADTPREAPQSLSPKSVASPLPARLASPINPPAELEATKDRPFQPQILRRPQSSSRPASSTSKASPAPSALGPDERKQSLLSLFNSPRQASVPGPVASPAPSNAPSNAPSGAASFGITSPNKQDLSRSMINSISTNLGEPSSTQMSRSGSLQSGVLSPPSGVMSPSELSEADRGSLMNYLEGVLKTQRK